MPEIEILVVNYSRIKTFYHLSHNIFFPFYYLLPKIDLCELNSEIHNINTRFSSDLQTPTANLTTFQKVPFHFGNKVFKRLPTNIKNTSHDINQFRSVVKSFLLINSFYSLEEYCAWNCNRDLG
jgi:hypothetical protein